MWTKKIEIKDENHLKEVVKALKSIGEEVHQESYSGTKSLWCNEKVWLFSVYSINSDFWLDSKDVPEYEIVTKTSYELKLKEVPKIKITCKNCGKTVEYKDSNDMFEDFVIFEGSIDFGNTSLSSQNFNHICKDCIMSLVNKWN